MAGVVWGRVLLLQVHTVRQPWKLRLHMCVRSGAALPRLISPGECPMPVAASRTGATNVTHLRRRFSLDADRWLDIANSESATVHVRPWRIEAW